MLTGVTGSSGLLLAARYPDRSLIALILFLPFYGFLLARLWAWGVPTSVVRHLSAWKETVALAVVLAGARNYIATGRRADAVDRVAFGLVAIVVLYLAAQGRSRPTDHASQLTVRLFAFRADAGYVLLLLGARHAPLPDDFLNAPGGRRWASAIVVAGVSVFEAIDSSAWNHFVVNTIRLPALPDRRTPRRALRTCSTSASTGASAERGSSAPARCSTAL